MNELVGKVLGAIVHYVWALLCLPHEVHEMRQNDLKHIREDLEVLKGQFHELKGVLDATRDTLGFG